MSEANRYKICSKCGSQVMLSAQSCPECGQSFVKEAEEPTKLDVQAQNGSSAKSTSSAPSKAPQKTCPSCGNKVPIRAAKCNQCGHEFTFKNVSKPQTAKMAPKTVSQTVPNTAPTYSSGKTTSTDRPFKALRAITIWLLVYNVILIALMAILIRSVNSGWFVIITTGSILLSGFIGAVIGGTNSYSYGEATMSACNLYMLVAVLLVGGADWYYFSKLLSMYSGEIKWGMGALAISVSASVLLSVFSLKISLKDGYCSYCGRTNVLSFSHDQNEKEMYGYKFKTHKAHTETATVKSNHYGEPDITIEYNVPEYQENLGLHKTTTKEKIYVCKHCGHKTLRNTSNTEKVDM